MIRRIALPLLFVIPALIFTGCRRSSFRADVSDVKLELKINRLEQDLFTINPNNLPDSINYLKGKYGNFLKYFGYVINIGEITDSAFINGLVKFCTDKLNNEIYGSVISVFPDVSELEKSLNLAFRHYKHYFPEKPVPAISTCITGFNNSIIAGDSVLGIGLDRYLGSESRFYKQLMLYKYQTLRMNPENILPDCMYGWGSSEWDFKSTGYNQENVLTEMIHEGKLLYFTRCMLPDLEEELLYGFTPAQLKFCRSNEGRMWQYLIENNMLFKTDQLTKKKLTGDAAFTTYFSTESPGRAAVWIGFRIVESYMLKNREVTLSDLMNEKDTQKILEKARYRPAAK
jgi:hypothetical protein